MSLNSRTKVPRRQKNIEFVSKSGISMRATKAGDATVDLEAQNRRILGFCAENVKGEGEDLGRKLEFIRENFFLMW